MLDLGWTELLVIGIVALIVVGPKDLPKMFRTLGQIMAKAQGRNCVVGAPGQPGLSVLS